MKTCKRCNTEYPKTEFPSSGYYTRSDGSRSKVYKPVCKACLVNDSRERYLELWHKYLNAKCSRCGYDKCLAALDVHHLDGKEKDFTIASRWNVSEERFAREAKKCVVLCTNCHRELHAE